MHKQRITTKRPLTLARETIARLTDRQLSDVAGGATVGLACSGEYSCAIHHLCLTK